MKKKIPALLLSGVLSLSMLSTAAFAAKIDDNFKDDIPGLTTSIIVDGIPEKVITLDGNGTIKDADKKDIIDFFDKGATSVELDLGGGKTVSITRPGSEETVADPTFSPASGTYTSTQRVTIECETEDAKIYYTTDDTDPTADSTPYTSAITVSETTTIKAIAIKGDAKSSIVSATYTINAENPEEVATPTFSPASGTYTSAQSVTIRCETKDAKIYYTTDGKDPTTESTEYTSAINVSTTTTIKAFAVKGNARSAVATAAYTINSSGGTTDPGNQGSSSGSSSNGTSGSSSPAIKPLPDRNPGTTTPANPGTTTPTPEFFTDVPATHWAAGAISWVNANGYMRGMSNNTFNPDGLISRQQMWMILARIAGSDPANMAAARTWAMGRNLTDGTGPALNMSRQQLVTFLYRFAQRQGFTISGSSPLTTFPDNANVADYAQAPMSWAVANGLVAGKSDGRLDPTGTATRAQFATILQRFFTNIVNKNA